MKTEAFKLFDQAAKNLEAANKELLRPEEDVVSFAVCRNAQVVVENYLKGYLVNNGKDPAAFVTVEDLYEQCKLINPKFEEVDLSNFTCKSHDSESRYCSDVEKVKTCFEMADDLDTFFRREKLFEY